MRERVPIEQVLSSYGLQLHGKRCKCPVHHGEHLSASVYNNKLHCFKCNQSWDAVALVAELDKLSPVDAAKQINDQYFLGLTIGRAATPEERSRQQEAAKAARKRRELDQAFQAWEQRTWATLSRYYRLLKQWRRDYAPDGPDDLDRLDPRYVEAVKRLDYIGYCLDTLENQNIEWRKLFWRTHRIEVNQIELRIQHAG
ncbi:CHC2 zinc finger domain-containing protein [Butyricicoccus porcorum]|uniref:CHC2 zinc finger domain-containing protein n=1 Tax=Butyricicoccus porcorum TaxID=1945634 RepID=UPI00241EF655|nr:CHC2 zinc finger domain-containing protein [Butyricicoccus porcorum]